MRWARCSSLSTAPCLAGARLAAVFALLVRRTVFASARFDVEPAVAALLAALRFFDRFDWDRGAVLMLLLSIIADMRTATLCATFRRTAKSGKIHRGAASSIELFTLFAQ